MSFLVAALWSISALFFAELLGSILVSARPGVQLDIVTQVLCHGVGFLGTLFFLLLGHEKEQPLSDFLGFRRTSGWLYMVAIGLGLALQAPLNLIASVIYKFWPLPADQASALDQLFEAPTLQRKIVVIVAAGIVGPLLEEVFFRGGIFRTLRRAHSAGLTLLGVSLLFAGAHLEPRNGLPIFLGGLAMGYARVMSGSLWPAVLVHVAYNSSSIFLSFRSRPDADLVNMRQSLVAMVATLALVALFRAIAVRSERCAQARAQDLS